MNIAFNTLSARAGAGINVFQNLMTALAEIDKTNKYFFCGRATGKGKSTENFL